MRPLTVEYSPSGRANENYDIAVDGDSQSIRRF
jgi:hypothetical protein